MFTWRHGALIWHPSVELKSRAIRLRSVVATTILLAGTIQLAAQVEPAPIPIPVVSLDAMEPAVRSQLEQQRDALEALAASASSTGAATPGRAQLATAYGELGQLYLLYDLKAPARAALGNAATYADNDLRWPYLLGTSFELDGDAPSASENYRRALELAAGSGLPPQVVDSIKARLARTLNQDRDFEAARVLYHQLETSPNFRAAAKQGLGMIAAEEGDHAAAIELLSAALAAQPTANQIHYQLGLSHRELGNLDQARYHLENRGERGVSFPDPIAAQVQNKVGGAGAMLTLGRISLATGEIDTAQQRFERAIEIDPTSAAAHRSLGSLQLRRGNLAEALTLLEKAVTLAPDDAGLRYSVAQLLFDNRTASTRPERAAQIERALGHLEEVVLLAPDFSEARALLASTQLMVGRFEAADATYVEGLERDPTEIEWHYRRAEAIADRIAVQAALAGAPVEAWGAAGRASLDHFLTQQNGTGQPLGPATRLEVGLLQLRLGDSGPGRQRLHTLLEQQSTPREVRARAALYLANEAAQRSAQLSARGTQQNSALNATDPQAGANSEAIAAYKQALELDPSLAEAKFNLATLLGRLGRLGEAVTLYRELVERDPENASVQFSHATALLLAERDAEARVSLERALEILPADPALGNLLARVLVASTDQAVRDAEVGLDLAFRLFEALPTPEHGETVAMALAESGQFEKAVEWQTKVMEELEALERPSRQLDTLKLRLDRYQALMPERSPWARKR